MQKNSEGGVILTIMNYKILELFGHIVNFAVNGDHIHCDHFVSTFFETCNRRSLTHCT